MKVKTIVISTTLIPSRLIYRKEIYSITHIKNEYIIKTYKVFEVDGKVNRIYLESKHPNCDPKTNEFCLPEELKNQKLKKVKKSIEYFLTTFNLDDCYFVPWEDFKYKSKEGEMTKIEKKLENMELLKPKNNDKLSRLFRKIKIIISQKEN